MQEILQEKENEENESLGKGAKKNKRCSKSSSIEKRSCQMGISHEEEHRECEEVITLPAKLNIKFMVYGFLRGYGFCLPLRAYSGIFLRTVDSAFYFYKVGKFITSF